MRCMFLVLYDLVCVCCMIRLACLAGILGSPGSWIPPCGGAWLLLGGSRDLAGGRDAGIPALPAGWDLYVRLSVGQMSHHILDNF